MRKFGKAHPKKFLVLKYGNIECVELLLQHDADVNIVDNDGHNAFDVAGTRRNKHNKEDIQRLLTIYSYS